MILCEIARPTAIRRTVCFSEAVTKGETPRGGRPGPRAAVEEVPALLAAGVVPVLVDPDVRCLAALAPGVLVDADPG